MKTKLLLILLISGLKMFGSSPQIPDKLIYKGKVLEWFNYSPALDFFEEKNLKLPDEAISSTANNDGFVFTYSIIENGFYLIDVEIKVYDKINPRDPYSWESKTKSIFNEYFPNSDKVLMENYTEISVTPYRKIKMIFGKNKYRYKRILVLDFMDGDARKVYNLNNSQFYRLRDNVFEKFKNSKDYKKTVIENQNELDSINENSRIKKFTMEEYLYLKIFDLIDSL
jgi:hypothetical protein